MRIVNHSKMSNAQSGRPFHTPITTRCTGTEKFRLPNIQSKYILGRLIYSPDRERTVSLPDIQSKFILGSLTYWPDRDRIVHLPDIQSKYIY